MSEEKRMRGKWSVLADGQRRRLRIMPMTMRKRCCFICAAEAG